MHPTSTSTYKPLPFTFDPSSALVLTTPTTNSLLTSYAHTGIGCNSDETTCLLELLDARDALPSPAKLTDLQRLSEYYLTSLQNTVERWSERTSNKNKNEKQSDSSSSSSFEFYSFERDIPTHAPPHPLNTGSVNQCHRRLPQTTILFLPPRRGGRRR